jgi:N-acetylmuramoyl-L-alanine amidase
VRSAAVLARVAHWRLRPLAAAVLCAARAVALAQPPLVVLDPGHTVARPGATSVRGRVEVEYNDAFVAVLAPTLVRAGFRVEVTRAPGEELDLRGRAARASGRGAWLLLSIHHDSAQIQFLREEPREGKLAYRDTRPIRGYSLFVSKRNPQYQASLRVSQAIGRRLLALGRPPTLHHAEPIPGEGRPLLDPRLGIYRFDDLKVVEIATCPAVLLEVGVLVDEVDEAYVYDPAYQQAIADAIAKALLEVRDGTGVVEPPR